jgi:hypothetical protein
LAKSHADCSGACDPNHGAVLGVMLVRRIEGIKAEATKQSAFHVRWADEFFDACQQFLRALEHEMAILVALTGREEKNDDDGMKMQCDQSETHFLAFELQLRIQRCAAFAPQYGDRASKLADESFSLVNKLVARKVGESRFFKNCMSSTSMLGRRMLKSSPSVMPSAKSVQVNVAL